MKNMILVLALSFLSINAFAGAREFRVNEWATSDTGYAIGWGVVGAVTDFEALDQLPDAEIENFISNHDVRNYLVDLRTNQILLDLSEEQGDILDLAVGNIRWGNHFHLDIAQIALPYSNDRDIVPVISSFKWGSSLNHVLVTKRTTAGVQVLKDDQKLEERLLQTVTAKLTPARKAKFENGSIGISMKASANNTTEITWTSEVPKSIKDPVITVKANVEFTLDNNDNILAKVIKVSYKEEAY